VPVIGDGVLYASATSGTDAGRADSPLRWKFYIRYDKNADGKIHANEIPEKAVIVFNPDLPEAKMPARGIVRWVDRDLDEAMSKKEFDQFLKLTNMDVRSSIQAIKPGPQGKAASKAQVAWKYERSIPHMSSSIYFDGKTYMANSGGRVTCLEAKTGKELYRKRLASGSYSASPVITNGNVYIASQEGVVTVFQAGEAAKVLATNDLGQTVNATPAIAGDVIFVRTETHLHAFGE
jgi:outer membrane protein assembly factor BamB